MALKAFSKRSAGERLRQARMDRGLDLDRVAEDTGIELRILEALERDAPPEELHGPVFARVHLREYARHLGLNPKPLVASYRDAHPDTERPLMGPPVPLERRRGVWLGRILLALSVLVLGTVTVLNARRDSEPQTPARTPGPAPASPSVDLSPSPTVTPVSNEIELTLRVVDAPSWIQVIENEDVLQEGTEQPGFSQTFHADEQLDLILGNAGAVEVELNGEELGTAGSVGEVYEGTITLDEGEVRIDPFV
jgi:cytoskeleton protein RodZ